VLDDFISRYPDLAAEAARQEEIYRRRNGEDAEDPEAEFRQRRRPSVPRPPVSEPRPVIFDAGFDNAPIPPRGWLLGNTFCRKFLSSLLGGGGSGKTAVRIAQTLAMATKRPLTGEHVFVRCRVLFVCLEDNIDELRRRVRAAMIHYNIKAEDVQGWLWPPPSRGPRRGLTRA
jgi:hypothetical protein